MSDETPEEKEERRKRAAWLKLSVYIDRLADEMPDLTDEQRHYLKVSCEKFGMPPGRHYAEKARTFNKDWAAYEAFTIYRLRGLGKMEARRRTANYFGVSQSRIRNGLKKFADLESEHSARPALDITAKSTLPPRHIFNDPD